MVFARPSPPGRFATSSQFGAAPSLADCGGASEDLTLERLSPSLADLKAITIGLGRRIRKVASESPGASRLWSPRLFGQGRRGLQPTVSGDAELPALPVTGCRELLGRHKLGQIRRLVERPDFDLALA
jgi:hypothetical protein